MLPILFPENLADIASHKQHYFSLSRSCLHWICGSADSDLMMFMEVCTVKQTPTSFGILKTVYRMKDFES